MVERFLFSNYHFKAQVWIFITTAAWLLFLWDSNSFILNMLSMTTFFVFVSYRVVLVMWILLSLQVWHISTVVPPECFLCHVMLSWWVYCCHLVFIMWRWFWFDFTVCTICTKVYLYFLLFILMFQHDTAESMKK